MADVMALLGRLTTDLPAEIWWMPALALLILGVTAAIDAFTGRVPDTGILGGLMLTLAVHGLYLDWNAAARHFFLALLVALGIYSINQLYYKLCKRDAIGMGDAKWTALAVMNFGWKPAAVAWGLGAWLGIFWMFGMWLVRKLMKNRNPGAHVHFAPFLFIGLLVGLWWFDLR